MKWVGFALLAFAGGVFVTDHLLGEYPFSRRGVPVFCDHLAYYTAGRLVREGRAGDIYDLPTVTAYQAELFPPGRWDRLEAFRNPPFVAQVMTLTAGMPFVASGWVWAVIGVAVYLGGLRLLDRRPPVFAVATMPAVLCVIYGQTSLLAAGVLAGVGWLLCGPHAPRAVLPSGWQPPHLGRKTARGPCGPHFAAGLVAGLLWAKPPLLLGLVVWGLLDVRRLWPAAVGCVLTGAALTVGSFVTLPEAWAGFVGTLGANAGFDDFDWWKAPGPRAFWRLLLGPGPAAKALWLLSAAAGLWGFVRVWRADRDDPRTLMAAAVLLTLWASPHAMIYDWAVLAIPGVLLADRLELRWPFAVAWLALAVGTEVAMVQTWAWGTPVVHLVTPALAWAGWRTVRVRATP